MQALGVVTSPPPRIRTGWTAYADPGCIVVLNLGLAVEVGIVFLNTLLRPFNATLMPGMDETARLLLVSLAFLGGAVAYGRGLFMAITILVDSLPYRARPAMGALVDCLVIVTAGVIGGASIPVQVTINAVTPEQRDQFAAKTRAIYGQFEASIGRELLQMDLQDLNA